MMGPTRVWSNVVTAALLLSCSATVNKYETESNDAVAGQTGSGSSTEHKGGAANVSANSSSANTGDLPVDAGSAGQSSAVGVLGDVGGSRTDGATSVAVAGNSADPASGSGANANGGTNGIANVVVPSSAGGDIDSAGSTTSAGSPAINNGGSGFVAVGSANAKTGGAATGGTATGGTATGGTATGGTATGGAATGGAATGGTTACNQDQGKPCGDCGGTIQCNGTCSCDPGLVAWYRLDGNAQDSGGKGYHGTLTGTTSTTDRFGQSGKALLFDGTTDCVKVTHESPFELNVFSLSAFIRISNAAQVNVILSKPPQYGNFTLRVHSTTASSWAGYLTYVNDTVQGNYSSVASNAALTSDTWIHVAITRTDAILRTYVNGVQQRTAANPAAPKLTDGALQIGCGDYGYFSGAIDDVRIYSRELSAAEVQSLSAH